MGLSHQQILKTNCALSLHPTSVMYSERSCTDVTVLLKHEMSLNHAGGEKPEEQSIQVQSFPGLSSWLGFFHRSLSLPL